MILKKSILKKVKDMIEKKDKLFMKERELFELSKRINEQLQKFAVNADTSRQKFMKSSKKQLKCWSVEGIS